MHFRDPDRSLPSVSAARRLISRKGRKEARKRERESTNRPLEGVECFNGEGQDDDLNSQESHQMQNDHVHTRRLKRRKMDSEKESDKCVEHRPAYGPEEVGVRARQSMEEGGRLSRNERDQEHVGNMVKQIRNIKNTHNQYYESCVRD